MARPPCEGVGKLHAATHRSWGCRGVSSLPHRGGVCHIEVTVEVVAPLSVKLDGDAVVLTRATALKFGPQVSRRVSVSAPLMALAPHMSGSPATLRKAAC
jgi:hypothetical protein